MAQTKQIIALYRSPQYLGCVALLYAIVSVWLFKLPLPDGALLVGGLAFAASFFIWANSWWSAHVHALAINGDKLEVCLPDRKANGEAWVELKLDKVYVLSWVVRVVGRLPSGKKLVLSLFSDSLAPAANARFRRWAIEQQSQSNKS